MSDPNHDSESVEEKVRQELLAATADRYREVSQEEFLKQALLEARTEEKIESIVRQWVQEAVEYCTNLSYPTEEGMVFALAQGRALRHAQGKIEQIMFDIIEDASNRGIPGFEKILDKDDNPTGVQPVPGYVIDRLRDMALHRALRAWAGGGSDGAGRYTSA